MNSGLAALGIVVLAMVSLNAEVLTDQLRVNIRDREKMSRIIGRIERMPGFGGVTRLAVVGGSWGYASPITTAQGDMNISAIYSEWPKVPLANEISGYKFQEIQTSAEIGRFRKMCEGHDKWPAETSTFIRESTAVVCLP